MSECEKKHRKAEKYEMLKSSQSNQDFENQIKKSSQVENFSVLPCLLNKIWY